ncbi:MAG TPA: large conductance mechanosensitive channel protein MscL [Planctomycetota bacterium]|nr:large conductance mechanosensitive channel protein MscL [Planctomycetota bacterium]
MGLIKEFKDFAARGNVIDMAVGVIIGAAFGKIVSSAVSDIIMPPIGKALGNVNFSDLFYSLDPEKTANITSLAKARETGAAVIAYGSFINTLIDFTIVAFCIFLMVKAINELKKRFEAPPPAAAPTTKDCPRCLMSVPVKATRCGHCTSDIA